MTEAGAYEVPMDSAAKLVVEELKEELDPVTVHSRNMEEKAAQAHPPIVLCSCNNRSLTDLVRFVVQ